MIFQKFLQTSTRPSITGLSLLLRDFILEPGRTALNLQTRNSSDPGRIRRPKMCRLDCPILK